MGSFSSSLGNLLSHSRFQDVLDLLSISDYEFNSQLMKVPVRYIPQAMHTAWTIVGHLELDNAKERYIMSLQRLKGLLEGQKSSS